MNDCYIYLLWQTTRLHTGHITELKILGCHRLGLFSNLTSCTLSMEPEKSINCNL